MNANPSIWTRGDFGRIAEGMRESGEDIVRQAGIEPGMTVLDLGCGDGTTALPAAKLGARVLGIDIAPYLVEAARRRAAQAGLSEHCSFLEGDVCDLRGVEDRSFDRVISMFGAMFAPRPTEVAREMVRVTRPGGRIVMGNWIGNDPTLVAQILRLCGSYVPPLPPDVPSPLAWGVPSNVIDRFGSARVAWEGITCERDTWVFDYQAAPAQVADTFRRYDAPTMAAFNAAQQAGRADTLHAELVALFERQNRSQYPGTTVIPATFLRVTVDVG